MAPTIVELAQEYAARDVLIGKVNMDTNLILTFRYQIRSLPTWLFIRGERILEQYEGSLSKTALRAKIESYLSPPA